MISRAFVVPRASPLFSLWGVGRGGERERGCSEAGQLYTGYSGAIMRKNHVAERNRGLSIVKLLDSGKSYFCSNKLGYTKTACLS